MWLLTIGIAFSMVYDLIMLIDCKKIALIECSKGKLSDAIPSKELRVAYSFATFGYLATMIAMLFIPKLAVVSAILFALSFSKTMIPKPMLSYCIFDKVLSILLLIYALTIIY